MILLFTYLLKVSVALAIFYGLHMLLLRGETFFRLRRIYFLLAVLFSFSYPFIEWSFGMGGLFASEVMPHFLLDEIILDRQETTPTYSLVQLLGIASCLVSALLLGRFLMQLLSVVRMLRHQPTIKQDGDRLIHIDDACTPTCSFFGWMIVNVRGKNAEQQYDMQQHERVHIQQLHSVDVVLYEFLCVVLWWNPFVWLLKHEMKLNLEYLADAGVQKSKEDIKAYQYLLLQISTANTGLAIINNFNVSQLKKRILMMNKKRSSLLSASKYLLAIPFALLMIQCNNASESVEGKVAKIDVAVEGQEPLTVVEEMPAYTGGEEALMNYIKDNLKYPPAAQEMNIQGRVIIRFVVTKTGEISDASILRGIDPDCDNEALRVISNMPKWKPGKQNGKNVPVYFTVPIVFRLKR